MPSEPSPLQPLSRRDLLLAAIEARSVAALGKESAEAQQPLDNRRFEFRMRLGCTITASDARPEGALPAEAVFDADQRRVTVRAIPTVSLDDPLVADLAGEGIEAAEGFWVLRPWLLSPACAATDSDGQIGLAEFFTAEHPRTQRRGGRPYEARAPLAEGADTPAPGSWDLVLRGRLRKHRDGRIIHCRTTAEAGMPSCLISVEFENVSIEDVNSGKELARWGRG